MNSSCRSHSECNRREFLGSSARNAAGVAAGALSLGVAGHPPDDVRIGCIGLGQQGKKLATHLAQIPGVRIASICDVDVRTLAHAQAELEKWQPHPPIAMADHRQVLDRDDIDAVVIATPDHWHAKMAIEAAQAQKDVYLEPPVAHSVAEGAAVQAAAESAGIVVQIGLPQRSGTHFQSAVELLQRGEIGGIHLAKAWAVHRRRSIGCCATTPPPLGVDYARWLGPAPSRPFQANRLHQDWSCFWDYGSGELGLWGVQLLDVVLWGMELDLPEKVYAFGGQRSFQDDRETPDTLNVRFSYPKLDVVWEHRQWNTHGLEGRMAATAFYGEKGTLIVDRSGWKVYDHHDRLYADASEIRRSHLNDFLHCVRTRQQPSADIRTGLLSSTLCHLGNVSYRLGREIVFDAQRRICDADEDANRLLAGLQPAAETPTEAT